MKVIVGALVLALAGCSSAGASTSAEELPKADEFRAGTCRQAAEAVLGLARIADRNDGAKAVSMADRQELATHQKTLKAIQPRSASSGSGSTASRTNPACSVTSTPPAAPSSPAARRPDRTQPTPGRPPLGQCGAYGRGREVARVWRQYLVGGGQTFAEGRMGVDQILTVKPGPTGASGMPAVR